MYENRHGRFTAVDPLLASGKSANPQIFNRYTYVMNSPLVNTDPTGLQNNQIPDEGGTIDGGTSRACEFFGFVCSGLKWVRTTVSWNGQTATTGSMELTENAVRYRAYVAEGESNWDSRTGSSPIRFGFQQTVNATTEPALQQLTDTMNQFDQRIQWVPVISSLWNSQRAAMEADRRTGSGLNAIFQTATFGVDLGTTVFGGGTSRKAIQEGVFSSFEDVGRTFYHGTDGKSALSFLNGGGLDASVAAAKKIDGPEGFFLATKAADAEFFAARRAGGTVLQFNMTERAVRQLSGCGMICQPIAPGKFSNFAGNELIVPPSAFRTFNNLRRAGEITVRPF